MSNNRLATYFQTLDTLFASVSPHALAEDARLAGSPFNQQDPLEIFLGRDVVKVVVERSIKQIGGIAKQKGLAKEIKAQLDAEVARRKAFLGWLKEEEGPLYVGLFPKSQFEGAPNPEPVTTEEDDDACGF